MYKKLKETVYPSTEESIAVKVDSNGNEGCHSYELTHSLGFENGATRYDDSYYQSTILKFCERVEDKTNPGIQDEQLILVMIDRTKKLNERFPSEFNQMKLQGLEMALEACRLRIDDRIERGVMGKLEK